MSYTSEQIAERWEKTRMLVCCVHEGDNMPMGHVFSLMAFVRESTDLVNKNRIDHQIGTRQPLDYSRSMFAAQAVIPENNFTHMFMYDSDMEVSLKHITQLLMRDVPCVSGDYYMGAWKLKEKNGKQIPVRPYPSVASRNGEYISRAEMREAEQDDALVEVDGCGAGCMLVTTELLRKIGQPAFYMNWRIGSIADIEMEDGYFARQVRATGEKVYIDPKVQPAHFKYIRVGRTLEDMNGFKITDFDI